MPPDVPIDDPLAHVARRPVTEGDLPFLHLLYATTRAEEMAVVPWTEQEKRDFVALQFHAQHTDYRRDYPTGRFDVLMWDGEPIGRLYVDRGAARVNIMEITLLPAWRNRGIGTALLREVLADADAHGMSVLLYVEPHSPAFRLYRRLGFAVVETEGYYWRMERAARAENTAR